jgi:hypothetical protein
MPLPVLENARNRVQVLTNLVFLMSSRTDMPEAARADLAQVQGELMLLSQVLSTRSTVAELP